MTTNTTSASKTGSNAGTPNRSARRTGDSLRHTPNTVPTAVMLTLGFRPSQAERLIAVRRILPYADDSTVPTLDARKLWDKIGKPHGRFNDWAAHYIKPELTAPLITGISVKVSTPTRGRPRTDYTLSRDLAAHLAMMARTPEGHEVRAYFLDMERLAVRLAEHLGIRVDQIVTTDRMVAHDCRRRAAERVKAGMLPKAAVPADATAKEKLLKSVVCEVLTGQTTAWWRDTFKVRSVRDVLRGADLAAYASCLEAARAFVNAGIRHEAPLRKALAATYGGAVVPQRYSPEGAPR
ncbi:MAG: antA/AntB antirepressor family protein [Burkholderiaceae bacterium]